jgi:hypothetical protein
MGMTSGKWRGSVSVLTLVLADGRSVNIMRFYLFQSGSDPDLFGFTADASGANLPDQLKPWQKIGGALNVYRGEAVTSVGSASVIIDAVQRDGFYLARGGVKLARATTE